MNAASPRGSEGPPMTILDRLGGAEVLVQKYEITMRDEIESLAACVEAEIEAAGLTASISQIADAVVALRHAAYDIILRIAGQAVVKGGALYHCPRYLFAADFAGAQMALAGDRMRAVVALCRGIDPLHDYEIPRTRRVAV